MLLATSAVVALFALSSRIPANPPSVAGHSLFSQEAVPAPVARSLRKACASCHSNETSWPWYARMPVASLLVVHDVEQARQHLNFSDWQSVREKGPEQVAASFSGICENLLSGAMPKSEYLWMHPEARLSREQIAAVCEWSDKRQMEVLRQTARTTH